MILPSKKDFLKLIKKEEISPVYREIPYQPPHLIYESLISPDSFLLESVKGPTKIARYSFIGFDPYLIFKVKNGSAEITTKGKRSISSVPPLSRLKSLVTAYKQKTIKSLPPFHGGAVGLLSYDFVQYLEKIPKTAKNDLKIPDAHFFMIDKLIAFDHLEEKAWIIVCPGARDTELGYGDIAVAGTTEYDEAEHEIEKISAEVRKCGSAKIKAYRLSNFPASELKHGLSKKQYMSMVKKAKGYIAAGDIFQANLSLRVAADIGDVKPWNLYKTLRSINPSPFACYLDFEGYQIVSSSPERLLKIEDGIIETRPIAGTMPRGKNAREDKLMRAELLLSQKERAEHIMLIDLERNDIGRVSDYGSVYVDEFMITEDYSHVMHIVSNIRGRLAHNKTCFDAIRAAFPGGTITGVPKVRCMEIIDELEPVSRGPYTGAIGYIGFSGNVDLNIVIRTFVIKNGVAYVQAGAGIVADSDPEREYFECIKKAAALIKTLDTA